LAGLLICLLLGTVPCWAHAPDAVPFKAFQFPDGLEPVIDGEFEDWSLVGQAYRISSNDLHDVVGGNQPNDEDFHADLMVGWSATESLIFRGSSAR
jgi:hypothetical protein